MTPSKGTPIRPVRVSVELWTAAQAEAKKRGETVSDAIRRFLREYSGEDDA